MDIIEEVDRRASHIVPEIPSTMQEMTQAEMSRIYELAGGQPGDDGSPFGVIVVIPHAPSVTRNKFPMTMNRTRNSMRVLTIIARMSRTRSTLLRLYRQTTFSKMEQNEWSNRPTSQMR